LVELKVELVEKKLRKYKSLWLLHVTGMNNNRMLNVSLKYRPNGQR